MTTIEHRLAAIERQLRFHRLVIAGLLVALTALVSYGATEGVPDEIRARKFVVVNEEGREVVVIKSWAHGGLTATYPAKGPHLPSILLAHDDGGNGLLTVANKDGKHIIRAWANTGGDGLLTVRSKDGKALIQAGGDTGGDGLLKVSNKDGKDIIYFGGDTGGDGLLKVSNKDGKDLIYAGANTAGDGLLTVSNKDGGEGVQVQGMASGGGAGLVVHNKTGEAIVQLVADEYGRGFVGAFDRQGKGRTLTPR
jgi:hypothetical protein